MTYNPKHLAAAMDDDDYDYRPDDDGDEDRDRAVAVLPPDHQLGMRVTKGGSMCANCKYLADPMTCGNKGFVEWNGGKGKLPDPADEYCCDLWEGK